MIPNNIYLTYKNKNIPKKIFTRWKDLNPNYHIFLYDNYDCLEFIEQNFGIEYAQYFSAIKIGPYKADFWRLCILYIYGGIYSDIDIVPLQPLTKIISDCDFCTCLAMNKKSIFQAFIACTPKNELIKLCLESFYNKRNDKNFLKDLNNCAPTYDMYNVFLKYFNKFKIKCNKDYYIKNQKIRILEETGEDYLNAYVSFKGKKVLLSRDIDYVRHNLHNIPWNIKDIPLGNYIETSRNLKIENDILNIECLDINQNYINNKILIKKKSIYENLNGFLFIKDYDLSYNQKIPPLIHQTSPFNINKKEGFKYIIYTEKDKDNFIEIYFPEIYDIYIKLSRNIKNYIWGLGILYIEGGIYIDNQLLSEIDFNKFTYHSRFISNIDIIGNINFNCFSSVKNNKLLTDIIYYLIEQIKNNLLSIHKIILNLKINKKTKILKIPGIVECHQINEERKSEFYIDKDKELLYILSDTIISDNNNIEIECQLINISEILNLGLEKSLFLNHLPILKNKNKKDYCNYKKEIIDIHDYNSSYSESL